MILQTLWAQKKNYSFAFWGKSEFEVWPMVVAPNKLLTGLSVPSNQWKHDTNCAMKGLGQLYDLLVSRKCDDKQRV